MSFRFLEPSTRLCRSLEDLLVKMSFGIERRTGTAWAKEKRKRKFQSMADESEPARDKHHDNPAQREERIRDRAYRMWEAEGRPEGRADQYWERAKEMIEAESQSAYPPTQSRGNRN